MQLRGRSRSITALGQLVLGIATLMFVFISFKLQSKSDDILLSITQLFYAILVLYGSSLVIDRIGDVARTWTLETQEEELNKRLSALPGLFAGRNDLVTFSNAQTALVYCISAVGGAVNVRNTILRYGSAQTHSPTDSTYNEWLDARDRAVRGSACTWSDIMSEHIESGSKVYREGVLLSQLGNRYYDFKILNDKANPMIQMTIIENAAGYKEIIFGWQFPGFPQGPPILTRNERLIYFFEEYFNHYWRLCLEPNI